MFTGGNRHLQEVLDNLVHLDDLEDLGHPAEKTRRKEKKFQRNNLTDFR